MQSLTTTWIMKVHEDFDGYTVNQHNAMLDTVNYGKNRFHLMSLDRRARNSRKMSMKTTNKFFQKTWQEVYSSN